MLEIKNKLVQLMLMSEIGAKYTTKDILDFLQMENTNSNAKLLKQAMDELQEYYVHKKINITDDEGKRHTLRGYMVISTTCEVEEEPTQEEVEYIEPISMGALYHALKDGFALLHDLYFNNIYLDDDDRLSQLLFVKNGLKSDLETLKELV